MEKTKIELFDSEWGVISGCYHQCEYCSARQITETSEDKDGFRLVEPETYHIHSPNGAEICEINEQPYYINDKGETYKCAYPHGFKPTIHRYRMTEYYNKKGRNIFVGSMADIFGEWVPSRWIREVFNACEKAPQHNYLFLTKNPQRYIELAKYGELPMADNMWYGTTVTKKDDIYAYFARDYRWKWFLSIEPIHEELGIFGTNGLNIPHWVIIGAETGNRKDKVIPKREWIESIVNQCRTYRIPVFMKSSLAEIWGEELIQEFPPELKHE